MECSPSEVKIKLHFCHDKIFVWDHQDALVLRQNYRIVGTCYGCYPLKPRQNVQLSLPILLSNIEARFVLEHQQSVLLDSTKFTEAVDLQNYQRQIDEKRKVQHEIQTKLKQDQKWHDLDEMAEKISKGKRKKHLRKKAALSSADVPVEDNIDITQSNKRLAWPVEDNIDIAHKGLALPCSSKDNFTAADFQEFKKTELKRIERFGFEQTWVNMPIQSEINDDNLILHASDIQLSEEEKLKYSVFCSLHNQGYFLTDGLKFGGHFLVYPGDPGLYHSIFIVLCVPFANKLSLADYSVLGRLATSVKKTLLLCSVTDNGSVVYSSLAWSGLV